jgi:GMP synthase-like glutamine amidotransferase
MINKRANIVQKIAIVNTHPGENPIFVGRLAEFLVSVGAEYDVFDGYRGWNGPEMDARSVILTGVPMDVTYSLAQLETQRLVDRAFGWLRDYRRPVLGICYGHQILAYVFGGQVSSLEEAVLNARYPLALQKAEGIFSGVRELQVFAEHRDYVSLVPRDFGVLSRKNGVPYIIHHPEREMYGVQFVPEQSDEATREILRRFVVA